MFKVKWINYAVAIIKAIHSGSGTIKAIAEDCDIPQAYAAKVISSLRKAKIIDEDYNFLKKPANMTVTFLLSVGHDFKETGPAAKIRDIILFHLQATTIDQIW